MRSLRQSPRDTFIELYSADIRENPSTYKACVVASPEASAEAVIEGLTDDEIRRFTRELRQEIAAVRRASR